MVRYIFQHGSATTGKQTLVMIEKYGARHQVLFEQSLGTYWTAQRLGNQGVQVIPLSRIQSVVMMAPNEQIRKALPEHADESWWYLMERPGLKITSLIGLTEEDNDND